MASDDIIKKIKALRAKVNNAASTEAEVEAAARMVAKLMMQHDVSEDLLTEKDLNSGVNAATDKMMHDIDVVIQYCWRPIEMFTETKCYRDNGALNYIGMSHDVEMALYLFELVTMSAKRGWLMHSAKSFDEGGSVVTKTSRPSYYMGFGIRIGAMIEELHEERQAARAAMASKATGTALVVSKKDVISAKMAEMGLSLVKGKKTKNNNKLDAGAFTAGRSDAEKVNLNRPFGASAKAAGAIK